MKPYYSEAGCTIYHGECLEVMEALWGDRVNGRPFDLLLTDPPYGIDFAGQPTKWQRLDGQKPEDWDTGTQPIALNLSRRLCRDQIIFGGNYYDLPPVRCWLSWFKPDAPPSMGSVEYAWTTLNQNSRMISWSISATNGERVGHPTQKPEAVIVWALGQVQNARTVLDPFMGSGTTLVATKRLGKVATGIEQSERYCELAAERLRQGALPLDLGA